MGSSKATKQRQDDPRATRALEREWVVAVVPTRRGGRPEHQGGRLTLLDADEAANELRASGRVTDGVVKVVHRPPGRRRRFAGSKVRTYRCRSCSATKQAFTSPRSCDACGGRERLLSERSQAVG